MIRSWFAAYYSAVKASADTNLIPSLRGCVKDAQVGLRRERLRRIQYPKLQQLQMNRL